MTTSDRLLSVLGLFTIERPEWTVEEASAELELAVSTAYRYFRSLAKSGLIVAYAAGRYVLGPAIIQYDRQMRLLDPVITAAAPVMKRLAAAGPPQSVVMLCRLYRNQVMCVHQETTPVPPDFAIGYERGRPLPLYRGAASKIILAHLHVRTLRELHARHGAEMSKYALGADWEEFKRRLRELRNAGISITQAEVDIGLCGVAAPLFDSEGGITGSLGLVVPVNRATQQLVQTVSKQLRSGSEEIRWALSTFAAGHDAVKALGGKNSEREPAAPRPSRKNRKDSAAGWSPPARKKPSRIKAKRPRIVSRHVRRA